MSLLKKLFGSKQKEQAIESYEDFWDWFLKNEKAFFKVVKNHSNIEKDFFNLLAPKLAEIKDSLYFLTGMFDNNTVELILTPDGNLKNIAFTEELVNAAPAIKGWKFTALKPAVGIENSNIEMSGSLFNKDNLSFYSNDLCEYPDEIDITIVHNDYKEEDRSTIINGTYIFLDNYIGELNTVTNIDSLNFIGKEAAEKELVPIEKLNDFLTWRQKEFIEKYEGVRYNTDEDVGSIIEAKLKSGNPLVANINTTLLEWDSKASHPWILEIKIDYNGDHFNGLPDADTSEWLNAIEDQIMTNLKDADGYLNIGRESSENIRDIYFACKDFRKPSKVLYQIMLEYANKRVITFDLYKDKYWRSLRRFRQG